MNPRSNRKPALSQRLTKTKHVTSMSCELDAAIWLRNIGQRIPSFGRCQLIITWMSNIREVPGKPRLHVSVNLLYGVEYDPMLRRRRRRRRRRRAYAPTSNTASHDNHAKINS